MVDRLTSWWVESISRFHRISGGGEPEALHTALTSPPCISVTVFGVTSTLGTTARHEETVKTKHRTRTLHRSVSVSISLLCLHPLSKRSTSDTQSVSYYNTVSHYHSRVEWAWQRPAPLLCRLCISGLDCRFLLGASAWSTSSHRHNPEGYRTGGA